MIDEQFIFNTFVKVRAGLHNKGFRYIKDWEIHWNSKINNTLKKQLTRISKYFLTVWSNIDLEDFIKCGFEVFKGFYFHQFFDKKIMSLYITKDKIKKRNQENIKKEIVKSVCYIKKYMKGKKYDHLIIDYCKLKKGFSYILIEDYLKNKITLSFLCWIIAEGFFKMKEDLFEKLPYICIKYRELFFKLKKEDLFLEKLKIKIVDL